jgi:hypothetical protein
MATLHFLWLFSRFEIAEEFAAAASACPADVPFKKIFVMGYL